MMLASNQLSLLEKPILPAEGGSVKIEKVEGNFNGTKN